ncbi:hypothetical protein [Microlunatus parietis]|uniref:Uncharacterized protein n=1 Tax=Microlunatus parietis TaxID=682979 RepID=A0A7Y9LA71_9ACTN|nr:hypothetical protein [Microlunatus parietis]NYE70352.1 hypothetical protein [Microlunatus parietis]
MISLLAFAVLVAAIIGVLEFTRRRHPTFRPGYDERGDRDAQRHAADLAAREPDAEAPASRAEARFQPACRVPANASSTA